MPLALKLDNYEIFLIHDEADYEKALKFQDCMHTHCSVSAGRTKTKNPRVMLVNDIYPYVDNPAMALDLGCKRALLIFLLVTQRFCENGATLYTGHACLENAFEKKRWCLYNVFTENKEKRENKGYTLPIKLKHLGHVNFWRDSCFKEVSEIIEAKKGEYFGMMIELQRERDLHIEENKEDLEEKRRTFEHF